MQVFSKVGLNNIGFGMTPALEKKDETTPLPTLSREFCVNHQTKEYINDRINKELLPFGYERVSVLKNDLTRSNGLMLDKDGSPYSGEMKTRTAQGGNAILKYENGLLQSSNELFNDGTILEETHRCYEYDDDNILTSSHAHTTRNIYSINPETGNKECHNTTIIDKIKQITKNGTIETKEVSKHNSLGEQTSSFKTTTQMAVLEDNTIVNLKTTETDGQTSKYLTFKKPDGTVGEMDYSNGVIKRLTLPKENGQQVEIQIPEDEPGVVIKKIFTKDGVTIERWSSEIFPESISTFKNNSIHRHYFNSDNQRKDIYQTGIIHQTIRETDYYSNSEKFEAPHRILIETSKDLKEKLEAANEIVPFIS